MFLVCFRSYCSQCPGDPYGSGLWRFSKTPDPGPARLVTSRAVNGSKVTVFTHQLITVPSTVSPRILCLVSVSKHQKLYYSFPTLESKWFWFFWGLLCDCQKSESSCVNRQSCFCWGWEPFSEFEEGKTALLIWTGRPSLLALQAREDADQFPSLLRRPGPRSAVNNDAFTTSDWLFHLKYMCIKRKEMKSCQEHVFIIYYNKENKCCLLPFLLCSRRPGSLEETGLCSERGSWIQDKDQL